MAEAKDATEARTLLTKVAIKIQLRLWSTCEVVC